MRHTGTRIAAAILVLFASGLPARGQAANPADLLPADAPIVIEAPRASAQVADFRSLLASSGFFESPAWAALQKNPGFARFRMTLIGLAGAAGMTPWEAGEAMAGDHLAIAITPRGAGQPPVVVAVSRAAEPARLDAFLEQVNLAVGAATQRTEEVGGARLVMLNPEICYAREGEMFLVANDSAVLRGVLERNGGEGVPAAAGADAAQGPDHARALLRVNLAALRAAGGPLATDEPINNPFNGYVFGGWVRALRQGEQLNGWLGADRESISLSLRIDAPGAWQGAFEPFAAGEPYAPAWQARDLPRALGEVRLTRQWERLFADREAILTLQASNQVANFAQVMTTLLGGLDFMDELLPRIDGPARLVMARQDFSQAARVPSPKLPAFALAIPLDLAADDVLRERLHSGALGALSIIGLNQGQNQQPQLMVKAGAHRGHQIVYAQYAAPMPAEQHSPSGEVAPVQYNFEPAVAIIGDELIVATTLALLRDIIDVKESAQAQATAAAGDLLWINSAAAEHALRDNTEELIMNRMLEENETREQATAMFEAIFQALRLFEGAEMRSIADEGGLTVSIDVRRRPTR